jgi:hypothetical protein
MFVNKRVDIGKGTEGNEFKVTSLRFCLETRIPETRNWFSSLYQYNHQAAWPFAVHFGDESNVKT